MIKLSSKFEPMENPAFRPDMGKNGELSHMLEQDLTITQSVGVHRENFTLGKPEPIRHERHHLALLIALCKPPIIHEFPYQSDWAAEYIVLALDNINRNTASGFSTSIENYHNDHDHFLRLVQGEFQDRQIFENYDNVLYQLLAQKIGCTRMQIREQTKDIYTRLRELAETNGLHTFVETTGGSAIGVSSITDTDTGLKYDIGPGARVPEGFTPAQAPDASMVRELYNRLQPAIWFFQRPLLQAKNDFAAGRITGKQFHDTDNGAEDNRKIRALYQAIMEHKPGTPAPMIEAPDCASIEARV